MRAAQQTPATKLPMAIRRSAGFTLVELLVAMTIGLIILGALGVVLLTSTTSGRSNERNSELQTNGRFAMQILKQELQHAGFRGMTFPEPTTAGAFVVTSDCAAGFSINLRQGVWGSNDANPFTSWCAGAAALASYTVGDVLVVRHASPNVFRQVNPAPATVIALDAATLYFRSAYQKGVVFAGATPPSAASFPEPHVVDHQLMTHVYYLSCAQPPCGAASMRSLWRLRLTSGPQLIAERLIDGVEDLQIQYGVFDAAAGSLRYVDANALAGSSVDTAETEWDNVRSVQIWLLLRSTTAEEKFTNTATYQLGSKSVAVNDSFPRQVFNSVVFLRN